MAQGVVSSACAFLIEAGRAALAGCCSGLHNRRGSSVTPLSTRLLLCAALASVSTSGCVRRDVMALPAPLTTVALEPAGEAPIYAREADALRIDQLQLLGSHNSYHRAPRFALTSRFRYTHRPLPQQLAAQGVRHLELDVRYAGGALRVGHAPIVDAGTQCRSFELCLEGIAAWSRSQPDHLPVFVFVQPKEGLISAGLDQRVDLLDRAIARVFRTHELLLPRDVARQFPNLRDAVRSAGWPSLERTRGKVAFVLFGTRGWCTSTRAAARASRGAACSWPRAALARPTPRSCRSTIPASAWPRSSAPWASTSWCAPAPMPTWCAARAGARPRSRAARTSSAPTSSIRPRPGSTSAPAHPRARIRSAEAAQGCAGACWS
jgi:hypothetical protein